MYRRRKAAAYERRRKQRGKSAKQVTESVLPVIMEKAPDDIHTRPPVPVPTRIVIRATRLKPIRWKKRPKTSATAVYKDGKKKK